MLGLGRFVASRCPALMCATTSGCVPAPVSASTRSRRPFVLGLAAAALLLAVGAGRASAAPFAFEPIKFLHIPVSGFHSITQPVFTNDGKHVLISAAQDGTNTPEVLLADVRTKAVQCITCSGGPSTRPANTGILNPFPDGKRIFVGFEGVIECTPSVLDCQTWNYLPYDLSGSKAPGGVITPGGAANTPQFDISQGAAPSIAPDGVHIGFSNVRTDGFEEMVVAKLVRESDKYVVTDPKVINPPGPTSANDPNVAAWSDSTGLFEFKSFTHGGADATYVQGGGVASENPDVWEVNLKTGVRRRLTSNPDWDEDNAISPNGETLAVWSNRTLHVWDWLGGLMPYRSFIDAPMVGAEAGLLVNSPNNLACGGPMWLLPASGDQGAALAGEPILDYVDPDVHVTTSVVRWPMWNPQSTMLALNATTQGAGLFSGQTPPFALVAQLTARKPTKPEPVVSSDVGSWAPAPADWHPAFGFVGTVTLNGRGGGTVTVNYNGNSGATFGTFSETYTNYSEDGKTFLNGTKTIDVLQPGIAEVHEIANITMSGQHTGYTHIDLTITGGNPTSPTPMASGSATTSYDGMTVTGPPSWLATAGSCPQRLPKRPQLRATVTNLGGKDYAIKVTASIAGVGTNEAAVDTEPVTHASIDGKGVHALTDDNGGAQITGHGNPHDPIVLTITAGDTLQPAMVELPAMK